MNFAGGTPALHEHNLPQEDPAAGRFIKSKKNRKPFSSGGWFSVFFHNFL